MALKLFNINISPSITSINIFILIYILILCHPKPIVSNEEVDIPVIKPVNCCSDIHQQPQVISHQFGFIISPRYIIVDPDHSNQFICSWLVEADPGQSIKVIIHDLKLDDFRKNMLIFYDGFNGSSTMIANYTDRAKFISFQTNTSQLYLKYVGDVRHYDTSDFLIYFEQTLPLVTCTNNSTLCKNLVECFTKEQICDNVVNCADGTDEEDCPNTQLPFSAECGHKNEINDKMVQIVGGNASKPGEWPWMVSMRLKHNEPNGHICGAIIINKQWLVTAAHCIQSIKEVTKLTIHAAKYRKIIRDKTEVIRYIKQVWIHPDFIGDKNLDQDNLTWYDHKVNDIALIQLNAPLPDNNQLINAICMPNNLSTVQSGQMATVIGWGRTENTGNELVLKQTSVPIITHKQCRAWMPKFNVGKKMICAGFENGGQDACQGDSGGPLFVRNFHNHDKYDLIGIVSTGNKCGAKKEAGIYTEVHSFLDWINNITKFENDINHN